MEKKPPKLSESRLSPRFLAARDGRRFYDGGPCGKCSGVERYVSTGNCRACQIRNIRVLRIRKKEELARQMRESPVMLESPQQHGENNGSENA